jgi:putative ABC transport system permease protein
MQDVYAGSLARTSLTLVMLAIAGGRRWYSASSGFTGSSPTPSAQRTREIGIRSARSAGQRQLGRMFLLPGTGSRSAEQALRRVSPPPLALRRVMSSLLFGIGPMDPAAYAAEVTLEQRTTRGNQQRRDRPIL